jgi:hypothetical protein
MALNSTIIITAQGIPEGQSIQVPMGKKLVVTVETDPNELFARGLRLQTHPALQHFPYFRTISPETNNGSHSHGFFSRKYYPPGEATTFEWQTLNLLPGDYCLVALAYDVNGDIIRENNRIPFVVSNPITITEGLSEDIIPPGSSLDSIVTLERMIRDSITLNAPAVLGIFNMNGERINSVHTGQRVALAININGMATIQNLNSFGLTRNGDTAPINYLRLHPLSRFGNPETTILTEDIDPNLLDNGVLVRYFNIPPHLNYTAQAGQLRLNVICHRYSDVATLPAEPDYSPPVPPGDLVEEEITLDVALTDDPVETLPDNTGQHSISGDPLPMQKFRVNLVTFGLDLPEDRFHSLGVDLEAYFRFATKDYYDVEVDVVPLYLSDLPIDYANWWNGLPKDPSGTELDPSNPDDLFVIRHIYAHENNLRDDYVKTLYPPQSRGEDITALLYTTSSWGGASQNNYLAYITMPLGLLFSLDYENDGAYRAPSTINNPQSIFDTEAARAYCVNIIAHELAHTVFSRPLRINLGHTNGYGIHEFQWNNQRRYEFLKYLLDMDALRALSWGNSLMSSYRYRSVLTHTIAPDQLARVIPLYAPPQLEFLVKPSGAPMSDATTQITISRGDTVDFVLHGSSPSGLRMMWYFESGALQVRKMYGYGSLESYRRVHEITEIDQVTFDVIGTYIFKANARDILYFLSHGGSASNAQTVGYAHQASEAGGLREVTVRVT